MVNPSLRSMTGYAAQTGSHDSWSWTWELRAVNARGLDIKLRMPDWIGGFEPEVRRLLSQALDRGNVSGGLRLSRADDASGMINETALSGVLASIAHVSNAAKAAGVALTAPSALDILAARGVAEAEVAGPEEVAALKAVLLADLAHVLAAFIESRATEGAALGRILEQQLEQLAALTETAATLARERSETGADRLKAQVAALIEAAEEPAPESQRLAQELALLAVKGDVTEEIDRLRAHIDAARELLKTGGPVGRRFDFLCQEFNREANTLCSKAQDTALTAAGLEIKVVIDQMREQVQNLE